MISVELFNNAIELHLDDAGIDDLIRKLKTLRGLKTHLHFMTPSWGGEELSESAVRGEQMNHLIIYSLGRISN